AKVVVKLPLMDGKAAVHPGPARGRRSWRTVRAWVWAVRAYRRLWRGPVLRHFRVHRLLDCAARFFGCGIPQGPVPSGRSRRLCAAAAVDSGGGGKGLANSGPARNVAAVLADLGRLACFAAPCGRLDALLRGSVLLRSRRGYPLWVARGGGAPDRVCRGSRAE